VLVGDRTDSATYVRMKERACVEVGVTPFVIRFTADVSQDELLRKGSSLLPVCLSF
jgi:5,10-methylene-tetrahydrofolate dehydrogenase/methenyl tetrahydrofolate cyclohydrolase